MLANKALAEEEEKLVQKTKEYAETAAKLKAAQEAVFTHENHIAQLKVLASHSSVPKANQGSFVNLELGFLVP